MVLDRIVTRPRLRRLGALGTATAFLLSSACGQAATPAAPTSVGAQKSAPAAPAATTAPVSAPASAPAKSEPAAGGTRALTIDLYGEPATLDPGLQYDTVSYSVYRNIFDNLLARDPKSGQIGPRIAKSWKNVSPTEWEFQLESGVKFHNGDPLTAEDVKYSVDRILNQEFKSPQFQNFSSIQEARVVEPATVRIVTKEPYPALLAQLVNLSIVPAKYTAEKGAAALNTNPVGSGPYTLTEWKKGESVTLQAAAQYWRGAPFFETVRFRSVPEPATRLADLQNGTADLILNLNVDSLNQVQTNTKLKVLDVETERVAYLAFNPLGKGPTAKQEVRQAVAAALNPKEISDALLAGQAKPVATFLTPLHVGYDARLAPYTQDLVRAKDLMTRAGLASGAPLVFLTSPAYDQRIVQAIQGQLEAAGIKVEIQTVDQPTYLKKIQGPEHDWGDIRLGQWSCACLDADGVIFPLFRSGSIWSSYSNPAYDTAVDEARRTLDEGKRNELYSQALRTLHDDVVGYALWQVEALYGARSTLEWQPTVDEQLFLFDMKNGG